MWFFDALKDIFLIIGGVILIGMAVAVVWAAVDAGKAKNRKCQKPKKIPGKVAVTGSYEALKDEMSPYYCGSNHRIKYRIQRTEFSDLQRFGNENMAPFTVNGINPRTNKINTVHIKYARDTEHAIELVIKEKGGQLTEPYTVTCDYKFYPATDKQKHYMYGIVDNVTSDISVFDAHCIINIHETGNFEMPPKFLSHYADKVGVHISAYMSAADICIKLIQFPDKSANCFGLMAWTICDVLYEVPDPQYERICNEFSREQCNNEQLLNNIEKLVSSEAVNNFVPKTSGRLCAKIAKSFLKERELRYRIQRRNYVYVEKKDF